MIFHWDEVIEFLPFVAQGVPLTLGIAAASIGIGLVMGLPIALLRLSHYRLARVVVIGYLEAFRNTPVLIQIVWFYYVLPIVTGASVSPIVAAVLALGLNASAYLSEVFRAGILALPTGQFDASRSLGMSFRQALRHVILPQAVRKMIPPFGNTFVYLTKETSIASFIGVLEIVNRGRAVTVSTFRPMETFTMVALLYLVVILVMTRLLAVIEHRVAVVE